MANVTKFRSSQIQRRGVRPCPGGLPSVPNPGWLHTPPRHTMRSISFRELFSSLIALAFGISMFVYSQAQTQVGYTTLTSDSGTPVPVATALFTFTNPNGILVSQAGVAAA